jgi:hypothetical protein
MASRIAGAVILAGALVMALATSVAEAQSAPTCVIAQRDLTTQEQSEVNDYEVQVARANSKHTEIPVMPDTVVALIGCESPASQTASSSETSTATTTTTTTTSSSGTPASSSASTFTCPAAGLSKQQESMINDFEILVARANSQHTPVPTPSDDVAALIACQ